MRVENVLFFKLFFSRSENTVNIAGVLRALIRYLFLYARIKNINNLLYGQFSTAITSSLALPYMHCGRKIILFFKLRIEIVLM